MALTIDLPDHVKAYIEKQVTVGRFDNEAAVIIDAVELAMESSWVWEEDEKLVRAIEEYERDGGISVPDTAAYLARLSSEARENAAKGHVVSDDVTY
jgi:Arc/MetJ-type ribon-helix-helix transcriptional regulator